MTLTSKQKYELKNFIKEMEKYKGRHTELVTVYIPSGYDLNKIINHLNQEQGTASNIKSAATKKNVIAALEKLIQHLRLFKKTPGNGLATFAGNVAEKEGRQDLKVWSIEPPLPINTRIYRCDKEFVLDVLTYMVEKKNIYGLVVMDRREGSFALMKGKAIELLTKLKSNVPGKSRAGGQSAQRFERLREGAAKDFYKKLGMMMKEQFFHLENLKGIIIGGPGPTKYDFVDGDYITADIKKKIIGIKDLSYTDEFGLQELVDRSQDLFAAEEIVDEKKIMKRFFELLGKNEKMVAIGLENVEKVLFLGAAETLLISEVVDDKIANKLDEDAKKFGTDIKIISTETREGVQLKEIGEVAAILRYEVH